MLFSTWLRNYKRSLERQSSRKQSRQRKTSVRHVAPRPRLEALEDRTLLSPYVVTTTADSGAGSLRDAINQINADTSHALYASPSNPKVDEIDFNITAASDTGGGFNSTTGVATIKPQAALPQIYNAVLINGYTQALASQNTLLGPSALGSTDSTLHPENYGDNAVLKVELDGENAGTATGLTLSAANITVQGLVINRFANDGIFVAGNGDVIEGNFIGTDVTGSQALGNLNNDVFVHDWSSNDTIGGTTPAARNIISGALPDASGNGGTGIGLGPQVNQAVVQGNFIGTDVRGRNSLANSSEGIYNAGFNNLIGGSIAGAGNVISGNAGNGITEREGENVIEGNFIGTDVTGTNGVGNGLTGILIGSLGSDTVGAPAAGNLISDNSGGISAESGNNNVIQGNFIGTDVTGTQALENPYTGIDFGGNNNLIGGLDTNAPGAPLAGDGNVIVAPVHGDGPAIGIGGSGDMIEGNYIGTDITGTQVLADDPAVSFGTGASGNTVGGTTAAARNIMASTYFDPTIEFGGTAASLCSNNVVEGNYIGIDATGAKLLGNGPAVVPGREGAAVLFGNYASNNTIGGTVAGAGNIIADSPWGIKTNASAGTVGNSFLGNSIFENSFLGIELDGGNDDQAAPVLEAATSKSGNTYIGGVLSSVANTTFRIEFFANASPDPSGYGEGDHYLGFVNVTTDAAGNADFIATFSGVDSSRPYISSTATRLDSVTQAPTDTSAFSNNVNALASPAAYVVTTTADSGAGSLRDAINQINADTSHALYASPSNPNVDEIDFNITAASDTGGSYNSATGVATIQPQSALPQITNSVIIDGYTQGQGTSFAATPNTLKGVGQLGVAAGDSSQYGDNAALKVVLDGSVAQQHYTPSDYHDTRGLEIAGADSDVQGLVITNWTTNLYVDPEATGTIVRGNFVGINVSGTTAPFRSYGDWTTQEWGIIDDANNSQIGGTDDVDRNVISGLWNAGIYIGGSGTVSVQGNFIGTDRTGGQSLGGHIGVRVGSGKAIIGGSDPGAGNLISGVDYGISDYESSDPDVIQVQGNFFGTDVTGSTQMSGVEQLDGIYAGGGGNYTGSGPETFAITGNLFSGLDTAVESYATVHFQSNYVGTDLKGTTNVANGDGLILYGTNNIIGGDGTQGNVFGGADAPGGVGVALGGDYHMGPNVQNSGSLIQGNRFLGGDSFSVNLGPMTSGDTVSANDITGAVIGVLVQGTGNTITGNSIHGQVYDGESVSGNGVFVTGDQNTITDNSIYSNNKDGIMVSGLVYGGGASNNTIEGNTIASNGSNGVDVESGTGNSILGNSIHDNGGLGIYLNSTNNANDKLTAPVLTTASSSSNSTTVSGTLASVANTTFRIEFFSNHGLDASGNAEGQTYLGFTTVTTDSNGIASFTATNLAAIPVGQDYLTATATVATPNDGSYTYGDSSAFSQYGVLTTTSLTSSVAPSIYGQSVTFTATVSAGAGNGIPTGNVDFIDTTTNTDLGTVPLSAGAASLTTSLLSVGTHNIHAIFGGGGTFLGSTGNVSQLVNKAAPSLVVNDAGGTYNGHAFPATATIAGVVAALDNTPSSSLEGVSPTLTYFSGTYTSVAQLAGLTPLAGAPTDAGAYTVLASFAGSADYTSATALANFGINKANQTITWAAPAPILYGTPLSNTQLDATVSVVGPAPAGALSYSPTAGTILGPGPQTLTVTAAATNDYNKATASVTLQVNYAFSGFLPPLSNGLPFAINRTIPIQFQLTDANGKAITSLSAVTSLQVVPIVNGVAGTPFTPASTNNQGCQYTGGQYQFNWQTKGLSAGSYQIVLTLADGTAHTKTIQLTSNGSGSNAQAADGSDVSGGDAPGQLLGGNLGLYVDNSNGDLTPDELARIQDAVNAVDATIAPYGVAIDEVTDPTQADVTLNMGTNSAVGGYANGILGCYTTTGAITLIQGWNWYASADPTQIGANQYDFQTTVTHELGHALGLGESSVTTSAMYGTLTPGTTIRTLTTADLNIPYDDGSADAQRAALPPVRTVGAAVPGNIAVSVPGGNGPSSSYPPSVADQVLANFALLLSGARNAFQSELSSVAALRRSADALVLQRLDALLSLEAGAMGVTKEILIRDLLFAKLSSPNS